MPTTSRSRAAVNESDPCQFPFNDGRLCRILRHPGHSCLCVFHARAESQLIETARLGNELAQTVSGESMTDTDINQALCRLDKIFDQWQERLRTCEPLSSTATPLSSPFQTSAIAHRSTKRDA
jgi:hypothetical protein